MKQPQVVPIESDLVGWKCGSEPERVAAWTHLSALPYNDSFLTSQRLRS